MANPSTSALLDSLVSKLAGSRFEDYGFGAPFRPIVKPNAFLSDYESLRQGRYSDLRTAWSTLSASDLLSFITQAGTLPGARSLFYSTYINLSLIRVPVVNTFLPFAAPLSFDLVIEGITTASLVISASGATGIVPANQKLLVYATSDRLPNQIFTNPDAYTPILAFDEGDDLSLPYDLIDAYNFWFGRVRPDRQICIKSVLIDKRNGQRGPESLTCSPTTDDITGNAIIDDTGRILVNADDSIISYP